MLKGILLLSFALVGCNADTHAASAPGSQVYCERMPDEILWCLGDLMLFKKYPEKCKSTTTSECDKMKCLFTEFGWLVDDKVNKAKVKEYLDGFASEHPEWSAAVAHSKQVCLGDRDLPPQGVYLNCAPYDIIHCTLTSFFRKASPSQWKNTKGVCEYAREYAGACPICPNNCFVPQVPYGSCNACLA